MKPIGYYIRLAIFFMLLLFIIFIFTLIGVGIIKGILSISMSDADTQFIAFCIAVILTIILVTFMSVYSKDVIVKTNEIILRYNQFNKIYLNKKDIKYIVNIYGHYFFYGYNDRLIGFMSGFPQMAGDMKRLGYPILHEDPYEDDYITVRGPINGFDSDVNEDLKKAYDTVSFDQMNVGSLNDKYFRRGYVIVLDDNMQIHAMRK